MSRQHRFELPHDISPSAYGRLFLVNSLFKASDKRVDEIMLQRAADLQVRDQLRLLFDQLTGARMQLPKAAPEGRTT